MRKERRTHLYRAGCRLARTSTMRATSVAKMCDKEWLLTRAEKLVVLEGFDDEMTLGKQQGFHNRITRRLGKA